MPNTPPDVAARSSPASSAKADPAGHAGQGGPAGHAVTELLRGWAAGDARASEALVPLVYAELRRQARRAMRREAEGHTLQPTALVHEAWLRLVSQERVAWRNRAQFFSV